MDSSTVPPPTNVTVPFSDQPNNHHHPPPPNTHPSYADMIYRAIEALKEKNGSTKSAISKYIEEVYNHHLPPDSTTHSTLLTQHQKRLKDNGLLQMVNKSYILPRSLPPPPPSSSSSRPRGRPRKVQAQPQARGGDVVKPNAEPVWAALGLSDEPQAVGLENESKGPGFPMKSVVGSEVGSDGMVSPRRRGRPPGSKNKKKLGCPATAEAAVAAASSGTKRRPGRPPKTQQATPISFATAGEGEAPVAMDGGDGSVVVKSNAGESAAPGGGSGAGSGRGRGSARGRGGAVAVQPRSSFGRPVGRPKKGTTSATTLQNVADVQDLKRILEYFQSKVRESLEVLKPYFTLESPVSVIAAIQDLEEVEAMDLDAPMEDETLPQQQQQQHQSSQLPQAPQQQIYPHQFPRFQQPYQPQQHQQPPQQFQPQLPHHRTFNP